ncbi:MAG TPA: XrtA system polysaccharide chain length determinant [Burkholderiaceae bacterium]|nr:XrtA system polysaccharide chain length determinant [Burkholderiaceae bacterium]
MKLSTELHLEHVHGVQALVDMLRDMWGRRWVGVVAAWIAALGLALVLIQIPDRYEARSRIYVDTQKIIKPLLQGITPQSDIDQMVTMLARTLINRQTIEQLMASTGIETSIATPDDREKMIDQLTRGIKINSTGGKNLYDISYRDTDGDRALRIVKELVSIFVNAGTGTKRHDTDEARKFIDEQIAAYEKKLSESEDRLKKFKLRNMDETEGLGPSGSTQDYFARITELQRTVDALQIELNGAEQARDVLQRKAAQEEAARVAGAATAEQVHELDARIDAQRKQLDELRRRYTDEHPDVVQARRLIEQLEAERRQDAASHPTPPPGANEAANIAVQQIQAKLADAEANVSMLRGRYEMQRQRLNKLRSEAHRMPEVESELAQLNRDYDVIKKNYEQLVQKRESLAISSDEDADSRLAEFRVFEEARLYPKPVFPSRSVLVPLALLLSLGAGAAACLWVVRLLPTVRSPRDLRHVGGRPVLGSVSMLVDEETLAREGRLNMLFATSVGGLVLLYCVWTVILFLQQLQL